MIKSDYTASFIHRYTSDLPVDIPNRDWINVLDTHNFVFKDIKILQDHFILKLQSGTEIKRKYL